MSFKDSSLPPDLENQPEHHLDESFHDNDSRFDDLVEEISNLIFDINNNNVSIEKFTATLDSRKDDFSKNNRNLTSIESRVVGLIEQSTNKFFELSNSKKKLIKINNENNFYLNKSQLFKKEKLLNEIKNSLQTFQTNQKNFTNLSKLLNKQLKSTLEETVKTDINILENEHENDNDHNDLNQNDQIIVEVDPINRHEFIHQQNLIIERENEIQNIESGITELNEIFNDLSNIIQEQGTVLDNIEANLYTYSDNVQDANRELRKASYYQKRSRGKKFCFLLILMVMLFLILVAMVLG